MFDSLKREIFYMDPKQTLFPRPILPQFNEQKNFKL